MPASIEKFIKAICLSVLIHAVSVLNLHKDERHKPEKWIPVGWMPIFDEKQTRCPGKGYESDAARKARLFLTAAGADQYHRGLLPGPVVDWGEEQEQR